MSQSSQGPSLEHAAGVLVHLAVVIAVAVAVCLIVLLVMRVCGLHWSWTVPTVLAAAPVWMLDRFAAVTVAFATGLVTVTGAKWHAEDLHDYLDDLTAEQRRGLAGTRDRLGILAESDVAPWLQPHAAGGPGIDLLQAIQGREVVYFRLDADRRPLLSAMIAAAIVQDLLTVAAHHQRQPLSTVVLVDEFSAVAPDGIARLFGRGPFRPRPAEVDGPSRRPKIP